MSARPRNARSCSISRTEPAFGNSPSGDSRCTPEKYLTLGCVPLLAQFDDNRIAGGAEDHVWRWTDETNSHMMRRASSLDRRSRRASTGAIRGRERRRNSSLLRPKHEGLGSDLLTLEEAQADLEAALELAGQAKRPTLWNDPEAGTEFSNDNSLQQPSVLEEGSEIGGNSQPSSDLISVDNNISQPLSGLEPSSQTTTGANLVPRFDIGAACETVRSVTMRREESMESDIVHKLRAATRLTVLAVGSDPTGRRIRVSDDERHVGWVSITSVAGLLLICDPRLPAKSWSSAVAGVAQSTATLPLLPVRGAARLVDTIVRGRGRAGWASSERSEVDNPLTVQENPDSAAEAAGR